MDRDGEFEESLTRVSTTLSAVRQHYPRCIKAVSINRFFCDAGDNRWLCTITLLIRFVEPFPAFHAIGTLRLFRITPHGTAC